MHASLLTFVLLTALGGAASAAPLEVYLARSGEISVREPEGGRTIAIIRPGLFEKGWAYHGLSNIPGSEAVGPLKGQITTGDSKIVDVSGEAAANGNLLSVKYTLTPRADISINSAHVSVNVPVVPLISGRFIAGSDNGIIPVIAKETRLYSGNSKAITLQKGDIQLQINNSTHPVMLQDGRVFNGSDLEIRIGFGDGNGQIWKSGDAQTISFVLNAGSPLTTVREIPMTIKAGKDWIPFEQKMDIEPGSALDFSFLQDAPAGKHGYLKATPQGRFAFEKAPAKSVRFYGVNLCFSACYLTKPEANRLAERLARIGYNTVRIHHYESDLVTNDPNSSLSFRPEQWDKLDYLLFALKKRGIYVKTDLFVSRPVRGSEAPGDNFKMSVLVSDKAMQNWKDFSRNLLEHKNPYTGLRWADDPTLAFLSLINEPTIPANMGAVNGSLRADFEREWKIWYAAKHPGADVPAMPTSFDNSPNGLQFAVFATYLHQRGWKTMSSYLRDDIKTKALLTYLNGWAELPPFMVARTDFDFIDNHFYWDHPNFLGGDWRLPSEGWSGGGSAIRGNGGGVAAMAVTRLLDKPFTVSEFNYVAPNPYRGESGLLIGAAGAIQEWDALWRFAYSHNHDSELNGGATDYFNISTDPANLASERAAIALFIRGDMKPASKATVAAIVTRKELIDDPKPAHMPGIGDLVYVTKVGVKVDPNDVAKGTVNITDGSAAQIMAKLPEGTGRSTNFETGVRESATGECLLDMNNERLTVNTPNTAGFVARAGQKSVAGPFNVEIKGSHAAVWATSLDNKPLSSSLRILLCHVPDVQNTDIRFAGPDRRVLESWGRTPHLVHAAAATVTLKRTVSGALKAWRLDESGKRMELVPVKYNGQTATVELSVLDAKGKATMYYELAEK